MKVGLQGHHGTFSEIAVIEYYKNQEIERCQYTNFTDLLNDLEKGVIDEVMLPVENTTTGMIYRTYDLLVDRDVYAIGEILVPIIEHLITLPSVTIQQIKEVYSHPEALGQCEQLFKDYPWLKPIPYQDTAKSVEYIKSCNDTSKAALASYLAAKHYGCTILKENVNDCPLNMTRFLCLKKGKKYVEDANKMSLYLVVKHEAGALFSVVKVFADHGINMLKLESRPLKGRRFEYCFYVDLQGDVNKEDFEQVLKEVESLCVEVKVLGTYKKAEEIK